MGRLAAAFGALLALLLLPLALAGPTAWVALPVAHGLLTALGLALCFLEAFDGRPGRVGVWGIGHLTATLVMVGGLQLGAGARDAGWLYWALPWAAALAWGWTVPAAALVCLPVARARRRRLSRRAVVRRRRVRQPNRAT